MKPTPAHMAYQTTLFDKRFLGKHAGQIMSDPTTALVELVANAWDAYATKVEITWPEKASNQVFRILDNGIGMSSEEFATRWRTLDYNRAEFQGPTVAPPPELENAHPRLVYGQNGRGRHAAFLFSSPYRVRTWKDGIEHTFKVRQGDTNPIEIEHLSEKTDVEGHGTEIIGENVVPSNLTPSDVRAVLSTRFLLDPGFLVSVDGIDVTFSDVPKDALDEIPVEVDGIGTARLIVIDAQRADRTTKQHGIAWWVNRRIVGQANWRAFEGNFIDGRTEEAKRYSFIVHADFLKPAVRADWTGFDHEDNSFSATQSAVHSTITQIISDLLKERRRETRQNVKRSHQAAVKELPKLSQDRWNSMLDSLIEKCPTIGERQIDQVMGLLATLEMSESQYSLLDKLHQFTPNDADAWNEILEKWTTRTAKEALDEISTRLKLIEEVRIKTENPSTDEVQELQPLFGQALWIFGPQFESIEFTSNRGMTRVIRDLFKGKDAGSRNRPDFVVLPSSTIGFYARPSFDGEFNENGTDAVVIVELKRPGVSIGEDEKSQAWKYIKELKQKGYLTDTTYVTGFVLGDTIDQTELEPRTEGDRVVIRPMLYSTFIGQAEKRMMNLHRRLSEAPFMQEILKRAEQDTPEIQGELLSVVTEENA